LNNILAKREAIAAGAFDSVLLNWEHHLTECTISNLFFVANGRPEGTVHNPTGCEALEGGERMLAADGAYHYLARRIDHVLDLLDPVGPVTARAMFGGKAGRGWGSNPWRYNKEVTGGGICIDGGSHWIRPLRMWLGEIEEVIAQHPGVMEVAVIGVPDERLGEEVKAIIVPKPGHDVSEEDIFGICRKNLAAYKKPRSIDFVDQLPKNPTGKILKRVLREAYQSSAQRLP